MILGILNQKGGAGKSTTATNLAVHYALEGRRVLLVDADPQSKSASKFAAAREGTPLFPTVGMARPTLHKDLPALSKDYDLTIIDGAPQLAEIGGSILMVADLVVVPVQPSPYDVWAAEETVNLIRKAVIFRENLKSVIAVSRKIVGTVIGDEVKPLLEELGLPVIDGTCQRTVYAESASHGLGVVEVKGEAAGQAAQEIRNLAAAIEGLAHG